MKKSALIAAFLVAMGSASLASADVAYPGGPRPPRPPRPPIEQPVERPNEQAKPTVDISILETSEYSGTLLFNFGFPDIGTYEYRVYDKRSGEPVQGTAGAYNEPVPGKVAVEFPFSAPEEGESSLYRLTVHFAIVRREPTSFGKKIGAQPEELDIERHIYIETKDGKTRIFESEDLSGGWQEIG